MGASTELCVSVYNRGCGAPSDRAPPLRAAARRHVLEVPRPGANLASGGAKPFGASKWNERRVHFGEGSA